MKINEVITKLDYHNKWRRGADLPMMDPTELGKVIKDAIKFLKLYEKELKNKNAN